MLLRTIKRLFSITIKQLTEDRSILIYNGLTLLLFLAMAAYVKLAGTYYGSDYFSRIWFLKELFAEPFRQDIPHLGLLTHLSELLWCVALTICFFSYGLLKTISANRKVDLFILCSAVALMILLLDDAFRITLILKLLVGIPKVVMYLIYGIGLLTYGFYFWRRILSTPYILLLIGFSLFIISGLAELIPMQGKGTPLILEDGTKLLGLVNIILYFWHLCSKEVVYSLRRFNPQ